MPNHLVYRAAAAIDQLLAETHRGDRDNYSDLLARAALEAVAADIWDEGYEAGEEDGYLMGRDERFDASATNPYRASEDG